MNRRILFSFVLMGLLSACASLPKNLFQKPTIENQRISFSSISFDGIGLDYSFSLNNPNAFTVPVETFSYELKMNSNNLVTGKSDQLNRLGANSSEPVTLPLQFSFQDLLDAGKTLSTSDSLFFDIESSIQIDVPLKGLVDVPVKYSFALPNMKRPKVDLKGISITKLGLSGIELLVSAEIMNPNVFDLNVPVVDYTMSLAGMPAIKGSLEKGLTLQPKGSSTISVPLSFSLSSLGMSLFNALKNREPLDFSFNSDVEVTSSSFPLLNQIVNVRETGKLPYVN